MIEYKIVKNGNKNSIHPFIIIKSYPGFFDYQYCTKAQVQLYSGNPEKLYNEAKKR